MISGVDRARDHLGLVGCAGGMPRSIHAETPKRERVQQDRERRREPLDQRARRCPARSAARPNPPAPILAFASTRFSRPTRSVMKTW